MSHLELIEDLLHAIMLLAQVAIVKCKSHDKQDYNAARGHNLSNKYARQAASKGSFPPWLNAILPAITTSHVSCHVL